MYGQIIWDVGGISACPIHEIQLVKSQCGNESAAQFRYLQKKTLSGICIKCGSLGYRCRNDKLNAASSVEIWKAQQVAELIALFPKASSIFAPELTRSGLKVVVSDSFNGVSTVAANSAGIYKSVLWGWMKGLYQPNLSQLLDLCLSAGVSLVSVLKGAPSDCKCPPLIPSRKITPKKKISYKERESALQQALTSKTPISLPKVASKLGLDRKTLRNQFPELSSRITERFIKYQKQLKLKHLQHNEGDALVMINKLRTAGIPCTHRNFRQMTNQLLLPNNPLWLAITKLLAKDCGRQHQD